MSTYSAPHIVYVVAVEDGPDRFEVIRANAPRGGFPGKVVAGWDMPAGIESLPDCERVIREHGGVVHDATPASDAAPGDYEVVWSATLAADWPADLPEPAVLRW